MQRTLFCVEINSAGIDRGARLEWLGSEPSCSEVDTRMEFTLVHTTTSGVHTSRRRGRDASFDAHTRAWSGMPRLVEIPGNGPECLVW